MPSLRAALLLAVIATAIGAADASAGDWRRGEIVVRYEPDATAATAGVAVAAAPRTRVIEARPGRVRERIARLRARDGVKSATRNWVARASYIPNDPGRTRRAGGWQNVQWNFLDPISGVDAPVAWDNLIAAGRPGGEGAVVAVVDTGVAYRDYQRFRRSPDLDARVRRGYDFVDHDRIPLDHNGHGTHVASTIAEQADNGIALTGLAYGATLMPVRVLNRHGEGDSAAIASGIRYAAKRGADVINLSFEFSPKIKRRQIPAILAALRFAERKGALVVAASGNESRGAVAYPARAGSVMSVGGITERGCKANYSNSGADLDIVAPGGGRDAPLPGKNCFPRKRAGRDILQMTIDGSVRKFGIPGGYEGTSMAAPHVSATAALVLASGVLGKDPSAPQIAEHLKLTADDLGKEGWDRRYGWGKVNAATATAPIAAAPVPAAP